MSDNKKYYYLKLKDNFFNTDDLILLETMQDGYLYSNILLKLYLSSIKNQGKLMFKDTIPYNPNMLASITRHQVGTIEKALKVFKELGLVEVLDNGAIYMLEIQNFIGNSTTEADRIREYRSRIKNDEKVLINQSSVQMYDKSTPELELEIELEKDIDIDNTCLVSTKTKHPSYYVEIIKYLNEKVGRQFRTNNKTYIKLINTRIKEGFTVDDFKKVINIKHSKWSHDPKMSEFLRPSTLFSTKFEEYLNEKIVKQVATINKPFQSGYDYGEEMAEPSWLSD